jgi:hypothetical protein
LQCLVATSSLSDQDRVAAENERKRLKRAEEKAAKEQARIADEKLREEQRIARLRKKFDVPEYVPSVKPQLAAAPQPAVQITPPSAIPAAQNDFRSHCLASTLRSIGVLFRALVPIKLLLQVVVLSVYSSAEHAHRDCELLLARCTRGNCGRAAKPFRNPIRPLRHCHKFKDSRIGYPNLVQASGFKKMSVCYSGWNCISTNSVLSSGLATHFHFSIASTAALANTG